ncbi:MAG: alpha/beta fold hydrolase [Gelidibacter sp.]|nr:alpha/beta fold hydrolase [Gelidibacter sp.]
MPILQSAYKPPFFFKKGFISTVYSGLIRRVNGVIQQRERLELPDGDFLDLDWSYAKEPSHKVIILLHGLEGNAQRPYMTGTAKLFNANGIDAISVNFRGCSGEPNRKYYSYHSGATDDLHEVILHAISKNYTDIYIKGISLGGNVTLKYLGERDEVPAQIKAAIAVSVPCSLRHSAQELHTFKNVLFHDRFKKHLVRSLKLKQANFPEKLSMEALESIKTLNDFDNVYTSKAHGFIDALDYYEKSSSLQFLDNIKTPTLIINALNDSFLSPECFPVKAAKNNPNLYLEMPNHGGHVGFVKLKGCYYNELRALEFAQEHK